jgi:hypothetical protein
MSMDLSHAWEQLQSGVPPEITHYRAHTHPGKNWWLKTACVKNDQSGLHDTWLALARTYPALVHVTPSCYDWHSRIMPWACTIWIAQERDVILEPSGTDWIYHVMSTDISSHVWQERLWEILDANSHVKQSEPHTWHNWQHVIQLHTLWRSDAHAQRLRKRMRVISDEKDSGT